MSDNLLPCPFCGGDDIHVLSVNRRDKSRLYPFVRCMGCYLDLPGENEDYSPEGKTAIAAWNRRAIPATDAREKALREAAAVCDTCPDSHWGPWMKARILALIGEART